MGLQACPWAGNYARPRILQLIAPWAQVGWTVYGGADVVMQGSVEGHFLSEEDGGHVIRRIYPEEGGGGAVPEEFAYGAPVLFGLLGLGHTDGEVETKAYGAFGGLESAIGDARVQLVGGHQLHG